MIIFYPSDYLDHTRADFFYEQARQTAHDMSIRSVTFDFGEFAVCYVDDEIRQMIVDGSIKWELVVYNGWQVPADLYAEKLYPMMCEYGTPMVFPVQYETLHRADKYEKLASDFMCDYVNLDPQIYT